jgi:predicted acetyltransferase
MGGFRVRAAREEDVEQLVEMGRCAYPDSGGFEERRRNLIQNSLGSLSDVRVIEKDGRIAGQGALYTVELWLGGRRVPCAGIASVSVTPGERREGISHALLEQVHAEINARKAALTLLYPFREGFYARLGYATTVPLVTMRVATDSLANAAALADAAAGFTFRMLEGPLITEARLLYEEVGASQAGRMVRSEARWLRLFGQESRHWTGAVSPEGRLEGYLSFSYDVPESHGRQTLVVHELTARDGRARRALLAALGKQRDQVDDVDLTVPLGDPMPFAFHDAPGSRRGTAAIQHPLGTLGAGPMVRLADAARALSLRCYPADGELDIVVSETAPAASKTLHLVVRDGAGEVVNESGRAASTEKGEGAPAIDLSLSTLGSMVAAGLRPSDARELGLLRGEGAALAMAESLFAGPRFQCLDPF